MTGFYIPIMYNKKLPRKTYLLLSGIFLISVLIRLPHLDRPLSKHHEFCTAITLIPLQNWADNSIATYHYSPSVSYEGAGNHHIENLTAYPLEADGRFYYLSHPPFAYLLPYFTFQVLDVYPTPLALQIFNLFFHFISCLFIYKIILLINNKPSTKGALAAFLIYLFAPATLWFHGNAYMSDMFISNVFIIGIWLVLKIFLTEKTADSRLLNFQSLVNVNLKITGLGIIIFLMIYTEWLGNFFAFGVFVLALVAAFSSKGQQRNKYLLIATTCVLAVIAGLGLIFWQYSSIAGFEAYWAYFEHRFGARSGAKFTDTDVFSFLYKYLKLIIKIVKHYAIGFLPMLLFGGALWLVFIYRTKRIIQTSKPATRYFLWLAGFPVLMHHLVFIEFSVVHDFAALKGGILIAVGIGLLTERLLEKEKSRLFFVGLAATLLLCIAQYYYINRPGSISQNGDRYDRMQTLGKAIKREALAEEVIYLNGYKPDPQVMYYAQRNMLRATDTLMVKTDLATRRIKRGVLFTIENYTIIKTERVRAE